MTVIPEPLPIESTHCRVRARISNIYADSADAGTGPDWRAPRGETVTLTPGVAGELLAYDTQGPEPRVVMVEKVECVVGEEGWLKTRADGQDVYIVPTDDPLLSVTGWTWTATIRGKSITFAAPMGGVADLAMFVAAPATDDTKLWVERIPELVEAAGNLVGIDTVTGDAGEIVVALTDGSVSRVPMPDSVPGPEGPPGGKGDKGNKGDKGDPGDPARPRYTAITSIPANYSVAAADEGALLEVDSEAPVTLTLPDVFPLGGVVDVTQAGEGSVTLVSSLPLYCSGAPITRTQHSMVTCIKTATGWRIAGDVVA